MSSIEDHLFQPDPHVPSFCKCGLHRDHREHITPGPSVAEERAMGITPDRDGNMSGDHQRASVPAFPKPVRLEDEDYLRFIRRQPCLIDGAGSEAAHIIPPGFGKTGSKVADYRTLPLCPRHHRDLHKLGRETFEAKYNVDLDLEQIRFLEMYLSALKEGVDLGAR